MASKAYMGRIFLAPRSGTGPDSELWINVGWNTTGNQLFPSYVEELRPAVSEAEYVALMAELKELFDEKGFNFGLAVTGMMCCVPTLGLSCLILKLRVNDFNGGVRAIVDKYGRGRLRFEFTQMAGATARVPDQMGVDQYGKTLERSMGEDGDIEPSWPPLGYNVVAVVPGKVRWPPRTPEEMQ